ncbi:MAG: enoyl-CoA hydratase-related protein [Rudaea sp.]|uniref:enoyl-CoA hydratase/isomerase family protein n=1 Tax=Rudaea sp. TaxID=2136325 RepID=UPI0039E30BCB
MSETNPAIRLHIEGGVATVTLSQPERGNPIDGAFCREFRQLALDLWNAQGLRVVHLRAEGKNFSFGGDVKKFLTVLDTFPELVREWTADLHTGLSRFWRLDVPVVAEVQGFAMGGAVALLAGGDVVVAAQSAKFGSAFTQLGFSCDTGSSVTLTARMGQARARRFLLLAEMLGVEEAKASGLVDVVVADEQLAETTLATVKRLAAGPTLAYAQIKRLVRNSATTPPEVQLEDEALTMARVCGSADAREGVTAMAERRKPVFRGA